MNQLLLVTLLTSLNALCDGYPKKCDQTPPQATNLEPSENKGIFKMEIETKSNLLYMPEQTYVVSLKTKENDRYFRWFMITAEDPSVDDNTNAITTVPADVGRLKTLDTAAGKKTRYSDRCFNTIESTDSSNKQSVEIHWISPRASSNKQVVRLRAMVAENDEVWYEGDENLVILLQKDDSDPIDSPPTKPVDNCHVCSEARYEVIFYGKWSRVSHPQYYPSKPDENGYTHMVGASHANDYILWDLAQDATMGLKELVENANTTVLEQEIIAKMNVDSGTRTLIRGKRRHHPNMFEPSHSLFRVDRFHHRFSIVVGMRPSPDWFLGTSQFELCTTTTQHGWWEEAEIPLYPWDAGTMNGVSYESVRDATIPQDKVKRVDVGSFNKASPFYQKNLNDLKPFALLKVRLLNVYLIPEEECGENEEEEEEASEDDVNEEETEEEAQDEPSVAEVLGLPDKSSCLVGDWSDWSDCEPIHGSCGVGLQTRSREVLSGEDYDGQDQDLQTQLNNGCYGEEAATPQKQYCFVKC